MKATGSTFEVAYKGVVYDVVVRKTDKVSKLERAKRVTPHELVAINASECPVCGTIMFNDVCMNTQCPSLTVAVPAQPASDNQ